MSGEQSQKTIIKFVLQDQMRVRALDAANQLKLPQCYIAAGFVRNLVWDHLHQKSCPTPLNDIDDLITMSVRHADCA